MNGKQRALQYKLRVSSVSSFLGLEIKQKDQQVLSIV